MTSMREPSLAEARIQESRRILDQLDEGNAGDV
jgi:hypothetical protein